MTNRRRLLSLIVIAAIPFVARWVHHEFRAPGGYDRGLPAVCAAGADVRRHRRHPRGATAHIVRDASFVESTVAALSVLGAAAASQVFFPESLPRFVILFTTVLVFVWLMCFGAINAVALRRHGGSEQVVAVVSPDDGKQLVIDVDEGPLERRFTLAAVFTTEGDYLDLVEACRERRRRHWCSARHRAHTRS